MGTRVRAAVVITPSSPSTPTTPSSHLRTTDQTHTAKMSWDGYIKDQLLATGNCQKGAICGLDGSVWAVSEGWGVKPEEAKTLAGAFTNPSVLQEKGIWVAGEKYMFLSATEDVIRGKKLATGVHITKTTQALIIGFYSDGVQPNQCATTVEALGDYLKSVNY